MSGRAICPACESPRSRCAMTIRGFRFRRCSRCRSLWVEEPPAPERAAEMYGDRAYFANPEFGSSAADGLCGYKDYVADREHIEAKFRDVLAYVERFVAPGRMLDVGAGPGFLLAVAAEQGWRPEGLEPNPWAAAYARDELGVDVREATLADAAYPDDAFQAVTMMDVLEHVAEPADLVAEAARITATGGVLAILTPDAGSPASRALGRRWPEVQRVPEHVVLFSVRGLAVLVERNGYEALGWHWIGKRSSLRTLVADVSPVAPGPARLARRALETSALGEVTLELDPRTKFCLYARRAAATDRRPRAGVPRLPKHPGDSAEDAILEELRSLARARRLCDWMFEELDGAGGEVVEVGAGIGTFSERVLAAGAERLVAVEPDARCAEFLERRFADDTRVRVVREAVPGARSLVELVGGCDLVVCQNVLEHIDDDAAAVADMAAALRPGGRLALLVPAHPRLFGALDLRYGHRRRYTRDRLARLLEQAGLEIVELRPFNLAGVAGWWTKNLRGRPRIGPASLRLYDALVPLLRALERGLGPPTGLSLIAKARRPHARAPRPSAR
jgi:SAM-dependent methyltransferase